MIATDRTIIYIIYAGDRQNNYDIKIIDYVDKEKVREKDRASESEERETRVRARTL